VGAIVRELFDTPTYILYSYIQVSGSGMKTFLSQMRKEQGVMI
jgi:hypothetical protein